MGLDSVEIVTGWEEAFGISIADAEAEKLRTPWEAIELIASKLGAGDVPRSGCLTLRAFHRLRRSMMGAAGVQRAAVRPESRLKDLMGDDRRIRWEMVRSDSGISLLPKLGWFSPRTVGDLCVWVVANVAKDLKRPEEPWTRKEVREVVRAVVVEQTGVKDFGDDADFIRDIGID